MEDSFKPITTDPESSITDRLLEYSQKNAAEYSPLIPRGGAK